MFTGLRLKNYKSLFDFEVDFTKGKNLAKRIVLVYGENGIGKSCFVEAFYTLYKMCNTRSRRETSNIFDNVDIPEYRRQYLYESYSNITRIIQESKSIDSNDNMLLEFEFLIDGKKGIYAIETDNELIVKEKLDFVINKNIVNIFEISKNKNQLISSMFNEEMFRKNILENIDMYWGKHSLISILNYELEEKNVDYIEKCFSKYLRAILNFFKSVSIRLKKGNKEELGLIGLPFKILRRLEKGRIPLNNENEINNTEKMLTEYFKVIDTNVKQAYYKKNYNEDFILYQLYLKKKICGRVVDVDFNLESTGFQNLLDLLPFFISGLNGNVIIIDEIDNGIHDLLIAKIVKALFDNKKFKGQAIITTHNTKLMESKISGEYMYTLGYVNDKKVMKPFNKTSKIQKNNNVRKKFYAGDFGGIPTNKPLELEKIANELESK